MNEKALRARLDRWDPLDDGCLDLLNAIRTVLDECALAEHNSPIEGIEGTQAVVRTDGLRRLIARDLGVTEETERG